MCLHTRMCTGTILLANQAPRHPVLSVFGNMVIVYQIWVALLIDTIMIMTQAGRVFFCFVLKFNFVSITFI